MLALRLGCICACLGLVTCFDLLLMHTNDMHSRFEETSRDCGLCHKGDSCYGGFGRLRTIIQQKKRAALEGKEPELLLLNAGDTYQGSVLFTKYGWQISAKFVNLLEFDALSLGNHEFDNGVQGLVPFIYNVSAPILAANLLLDKEPDLAKSPLKKSTIITKNGTRIGIIGYLTPDTKFLSQSGKVEYEDEIEAIKKEVISMKKLGINILIAIGHSGYPKDLQIAQEVEDIDIVVGGHTNTFLYTGNPPDDEVPVDVYPKVVTQKSGRKVLVVQSYAYTKYIGSLYLSFTPEGEVVNFKGNPILVNSSIEQDPVVLHELENWKKDLKYDQEVIGKSLVYLDNVCRIKECNLGNLITDSLVDYVAEKRLFVDNTTWTDAAIAIFHGGGIRSSLDEKYDVIRESLQIIFPFNTSLLIMSARGKTLKEMLEWSVSNFNASSGLGRFLQMSGIHVKYDINKEQGQRVSDVEVRCRKCRIPSFQPLNFTKIYKIIIPDFLFNGGDGYNLAEASLDVHLNISERLVLEHYIKKYTPIYPGTDGRIIFLHHASKEKISASNKSFVSKISNELILLFLILLFSI